MKRWKKILFAALLAPPLLLIGGLAVLRWKFPPERLRALALDWARDHLHREVRLGAVRWGGFGLEISDLDIRERAGFPEGSFLSARRLLLRPNYFMLLSRRFGVDTLHADALQVHLRRRADGTLNIDDLSPSGPSAAPPSSGTPSLDTSLWVRKIALTEGRLRWTDDTNGNHLDLHPFRFGVTSFSLQTPFEANMSGGLTGRWDKKPLAATFSLEADASLPETSLNIRRGEFSMNGSTFTLRGSLKIGEPPTLDLTVGLRPFFADSLAPFVPLPTEARGLRAQGELRVEGTPKSLRTTGTLALSSPGASGDFGLDLSFSPGTTPVTFNATLSPKKIALAPGGPAGDFSAEGPLDGSLGLQGTPEAVDFTWDLDVTHCRLSKNALFEKPAPWPLRVKGAGKFTPGQIRLASLTLDSAAGNLQLSGRVWEADKSQRFDLKTTAPGLDLWAVKDLLPDLRSLAPRGRLGWDLRLDGDTESPRAQGTLTLEDLGASPLPGASLDALRGTLTLAPDALTAPDLRGRWMGSPFQTSLAVRKFSRPDVTLNGRLDRLDMDKTLAVFSSTPPAPAAPGTAAAPLGPPPLAKLTGQFLVGELSHRTLWVKDFSLKYALADLGPDLRTARGTVGLATGAGKVRDIPLAQKISQFVKKDTADVPFDKATAQFRLAEGVLSTDDFLLQSRSADLGLKGTVRLTDLDAALSLTAILPAGALGGSVGEWTAGPDGRPRLGATLKGPLTDPTLRPEVSQAAEKAAKDLLKKGLEKWGVLPSSVDKSSDTDKAVDRAVEQGKKALEKLFKRR